MPMLQCPKCKDFVDSERNAFCPNCGTPLTEPQPAPQDEPALCPPVQEAVAEPVQEVCEQPGAVAQPVQEQPPVQQPVYQYLQPGQPLPQPPQGARQVVYICQPAPRPRNGGAITGFVFGTIALCALLVELLSIFVQQNSGLAVAQPGLLILFSIPGLVLGIVSTCKKSCTKRVFAILALIFSAFVMLVSLAGAVISAQLP